MNCIFKYDFNKSNTTFYKLWKVFSVHKIYIQRYWNVFIFSSLLRD